VLRPSASNPPSCHPSAAHFAVAFSDFKRPYRKNGQKKIVRQVCEHLTHGHHHRQWCHFWDWVTPKRCLPQSLRPYGVAGGVVAASAAGLAAGAAELPPKGWGVAILSKLSSTAAGRLRMAVMAAVKATPPGQDSPTQKDFMLHRASGKSPMASNIALVHK
jgi:hypothetical protein